MHPRPPSSNGPSLSRPSLRRPAVRHAPPIVCLARVLDSPRAREKHLDLQRTKFDTVKPELRDLLKELLTTPLRDNEEIVIPTGSLFIEALPGVHPVLEDFKLMHRAIDVKRAQADVRRAEMENLRYAARLVSGERDDPEIEKKIVVQGAVNPTVDVDNP